ncbi:RagB/SusD family nutrient uptake outer membrane protein [Pseudopedobacter beijingensis]|uniref:RagB/SusD family nutrient uptake outer membrane protein n=1 Tax=Pseudopedobacter beijingensis TaxID=1207056 RepID=A0ABW4IDQ6_9SPHI
MKHFVLIFLSIVFLLVSSCKDPLQITDPNWLEEESFYKNEKEAFLGLVGVYDAFQARGLMGKSYREFDIITDNATYRSGAEWRAIESDIHISSDARIARFWTDYYVIINRANRMIDKVSVMPDDLFKSQSKSRILAEAAFLRAYAYYDLTAIWGNVPFYTKTKERSDAAEAATFKKDIYAWIINDLKTFVIPNLPKIVPLSERGRIPKAAAEALLGKYYLTEENWSKAAEIFFGIIDSKQYELYPDYAELFTEKGEFSKESLFEINFTGKGIDTGEGFSTRIDTTLALTWPSQQIIPIADLVDSYLCTDGKPIVADYSPNGYGAKSPGYVSGSNNVNTNTTRFKDRDPRLRASIYTFMDKRPSGVRLWNYNNVGDFAIKKYSIISSQQYENGGPQNYYVIRYADVLLMYAEAKNEELAIPDQSIYDAVNEIRNRLKTMALYPAGLTKEQMRKRIRDERRWEFAFEHQRFFDLKRWKDDQGNPLLLTLPPASFPADNEGVFRKRASIPRVYTWPYPQEEMDGGNRALQAQGQNQGYY